MSVTRHTEEPRVGLASPELERFNPSHEDFRANPYVIYERYRKLDPIHWGELPEPLVPGLRGL